MTNLPAPAANKWPLLLLAFFVLAAVGCRRDQPAMVEPTATITASALIPVEPDPSATLAPVSPTGTPAADNQPTSIPLVPQTTATPGTATPTVDPATFGQGERFGLYVSYTVEEDGEAGGQKGFVVVASIENMGEQPFIVGEQSLSLVASDGLVYAPEPAAATGSPPLLGAEVPPGETFLGLVKFVIPTEVTATRLQWCPTGGAECEEQLSAPIP